MKPDIRQDTKKKDIRCNPNQFPEGELDAPVPRYLDSDLLEQMFGSVVEEGEGVVVGLHPSCPALARFLSLTGGMANIILFYFDNLS